MLFIVGNIIEIRIKKKKIIDIQEINIAMGFSQLMFKNINNRNIITILYSHH